MSAPTVQNELTGKICAMVEQYIDQVPDNPAKRTEAIYRATNAIVGEYIKGDEYQIVDGNFYTCGRCGKTYPPLDSMRLCENCITETITYHNDYRADLIETKEKLESVKEMILDTDNDMPIDVVLGNTVVKLRNIVDSIKTEEE